MAVPRDRHAGDQLCRPGEETAAKCARAGQVVAAVADGGQLREVVISVYRHRLRQLAEQRSVRHRVAVGNAPRTRQAVPRTQLIDDADLVARGEDAAWIERLIEGQ